MRLGVDDRGSGERGVGVERRERELVPRFAYHDTWSVSFGIRLRFDLILSTDRQTRLQQPSQSHPAGPRNFASP